MEALGTWRDLEAFATGRRTTDLRPDDGGSARDGTLADGDGGSAHDLSLVDRATTTLLLDNSNLKECVFSQLQLRALHTLSLSYNRLRCLDPGIASFATSLAVAYVSAGGGAGAPLMASVALPPPSTRTAASLAICSLLESVGRSSS